LETAVVIVSIFDSSLLIAALALGARIGTHSARPISALCDFIKPGGSRS
jgi:hypothetical protein